MEKLKIVSEKKAIILPKKPCVGLSQEVYDLICELSEHSGISKTVLASEMIKFAYKYLEIVEV